MTFKLRTRIENSLDWKVNRVRGGFTATCDRLKLMVKAADILTLGVCADNAVRGTISGAISGLKLIVGSDPVCERCGQTVEVAGSFVHCPTCTQEA